MLSKDDRGEIVGIAEKQRIYRRDGERKRVDRCGKLLEYNRKECTKEACRVERDW